MSVGPGDGKKGRRSRARLGATATRLVRSVAGRLRSLPGVWPLAPLRRLAEYGRLRRASALVGSSTFFDRDWYLQRYPDVAAAGLDPLRHYVRQGWREGRDPGPRFQSKAYLRDNPDVAAAGVNPLVHYLTKGRLEGRAAGSVVDIAQRVLQAITELEAERGVVRVLESCSEPGPARETLDVEALRRRLPDGDGPDLPAEAAPAFALFLLACGRLAAPGDLPEAAGEGILTAPREGPLALADLWFVNDFDLRLRFAPTEVGIVSRLTFFQPTSAGEGNFRLVDEARLFGSPIEFVTVRLENPFLPLLVLADHDEARSGRVLVLPFPSLSRGGAHYAELVAAANSEDLLGDHLRLSLQFLAGVGRRADRLGEIAVDFVGANGSERIFSPTVVEFLARYVRLRADGEGNPDTAPEAIAFLQGALEGLDPSSRTLHETRTLRIPADSLPTLQALCLPPPAVAAAPYLVADRATSEPRWAVTPPQGSEALLPVQPVGAALAWPLVSPGGDELAGCATGSAFPAAISFRDCSPTEESTLILPRAAGSRVLGGDEQESAPQRIALLLPSPERLEPTDLEALFSSLRMQEEAEIAEILLPASPSAALRQAAERHFPNLARTVAKGAGQTVDAWRKRAAREARVPFTLTVGEPVVLHDPRTLRTLAELAAQPFALSVGCLLVHPPPMGKPAKEARADAGLCRLARSFDPEGVSAIGPLPIELALPPLTYPVARPSAALSMTAVRSAASSAESGTRPFHLRISALSAEWRPRDRTAALREDADGESLLVRELAR